jgi:hypothetical protein
MAVLDPSGASERKRLLAECPRARPFASHVGIDGQPRQHLRQSAIVAEPTEDFGRLLVVAGALRKLADDEDQAPVDCEQARLHLVRIRPAFEQRVEPPSRLEWTGEDPELLECEQQTGAELDVGSDGPLQCGADVRQLGRDEVVSLVSLGFQREVRRLREREQPLAQTPSCRVSAAGGFQPLARVLANRLEHPEASVGVANEALLDERLEQVDIGVGDLLGGLDGATADEDRERREQPLLLRREQLVAPLDRRPQRGLARVGVTAALEQVEALSEPLDDLVGRQRCRTRGGELHGQGQIVEPAAELGDVLVGFEPRPDAEQLHRLGLRQRRYGILGLAVDPQQLPAGHDQAEVRTRPQQRGQLGRRFDYLLEVVQEQEQLPPADRRGEIFLGAQRLRDRLDNQRGIVERRQADPEDTRLQLPHQLGRRLDRESRLAGPARPGQGDEPSPAADQLDDVRDLALAAQEGARRPR